ncbi:sigma-70 family RNA polymerase sigma factor [Shewanella eurypsychrophilus]|uniref:Sigma-70 family RNA polymerase sigma factor n=1 Tax=Shewanella eurypsychrophilus TaxID=2593656 RepID=A0ABX6V4U2_9GAMM|nr:MULTISPECIES: sigma-70 family RNA polymerase sigma factor [Shewanella]QFU21289.1 hypothetical protein FS418_05005 [Shewanella sp. YLB-09]QPG56580.1 sigma-70 family RNA polymerase sigma factor [Shewanella eurypsychrophilus]
MRHSNSDSPSIAELLTKVGEVFETNQNKFNRGMFSSLPDHQQLCSLQNFYDSGMAVSQIAKMTGMPESTVYSKITTRR